MGHLVLSKQEKKVIDQHYQVTLQRLQKLHDKTPRSIVFLLAGSLPGEAFMDLRQLSIYSMICHLPTDPLHLHAHHVLTLAPPSANSWFQQVRDLCRKYGLPHPSTLLNNPMSKEKFKRLAKLKVTEYWRNVLFSECVHLESLTYFDPHKCSLQTPHPIWSSAASSSYKCNKAFVVARMVSGRYRTEMM